MSRAIADSVVALGEADDGHYLGHPTPVTVDLSDPRTVQDSPGEGDVIRSISRVVGTSGADSLAGTGSADMLDGSWGDDPLTGREGADRLRGGSGADELPGRARRRSLVLLRLPAWTSCATRPGASASTPAARRSASCTTAIGS